MLVNIEDVVFSYGGNLILDNVSCTLHEGERIGLVGANGEGKTTLIKILTGELFPDMGKVFLKGGIRIGYLEQSAIFESGLTVYNEMKSVFKEELAAIERRDKFLEGLESCSGDEYKRLSQKIAALNDFIAARDAYNVDVKIKTVLNGMGFESVFEQEVAALSGGERTRLKLARLLLEEPDLLVLDEPTNHLDIKTLFWLEDYLARFKGAILLVSHDRFFLDKICGRIIEIENHGLLCFSGNYSKYKTLKAELNARRLKEAEAAEEERAKLQDYIARNIVRATTAKSAQSRVKKLEKLEPPQKPYTPPKAAKFSFRYENPPYETVLKSDEINLKIGDKSLIVGGQLNIRRGEKVALVGENGTGKSTLLKSILSGKMREVVLGRFVNIAYYDQESNNLNLDNTVLQELWERHVLSSQTEIRATLARAGLYEEDMDKPVRALSGGERAKLALAVLESEKGNFLILDEPTNHLDLPSRESLESALKSFDGTLLFVSHDRYFISALANRIVEIEDKLLKNYEGNYDFYIEEKKRLSEVAVKSIVQKPQAKSDGFRSRADRAAEARRVDRIREIEKKIGEAEEREAEILSSIADPEIACDYKKLAPFLKEEEDLKKLLDELYKEYGDMV